MNLNMERARQAAAQSVELRFPDLDGWEYVANAAIDAFLAAARADGWKLVRREATEEMCKAGMAANFGEVQVRGIPQAEVKLGPPGARRVFAAMWDSAPEEKP